jgi:hypothetical protein
LNNLRNLLNIRIELRPKDNRISFDGLDPWVTLSVIWMIGWLYSLEKVSQKRLRRDAEFEANPSLGMSLEGLASAGTAIMALSNGAQQSDM